MIFCYKITNIWRCWDNNAYPRCLAIMWNKKNTFVAPTWLCNTIPLPTTGRLYLQFFMLWRLVNPHHPGSGHRANITKPIAAQAINNHNIVVANIYGQTRKINRIDLHKLAAVFAPAESTSFRLTFTLERKTVAN